jgi:hypothetical protein
LAAKKVDAGHAAVFPLHHLQCVIGRQQAAPHEEAQQAQAYLRLDFGDGGGIEPCGGMEDDPAAAAASNTPSMRTQWK